MLSWRCRGVANLYKESLCPLWTFWDPDGDTKISGAEMAGCALPEAVDMNSDGKLTVEEVVALEGTDLGHERGPGEPGPE